MLSTFAAQRETPSSYYWQQIVEGPFADAVPAFEMVSAH